MLRYFLIFIRCKISFKIKRRNVLIFDHAQSSTIKNIIDKNDYNFFYSRHEEYNFFILLKTLIFSGFKNFGLNYFLNFVKLTQPKFIISQWLYDPRMFKIKNYFPKIKTILIQSSDFFFEISEFKKYDRYSVDYLFVFSNNEKKKLKNFFKKSEIIVIGSLRNNYYYDKKKEKRHFLYISEYKISKFTYNEKKIINLIDEYCDKNNFKFDIQTRYKSFKFKQYLNEIKNLRLNNLNKSLEKKHDGNTYENFQKYEFLVSTDSTIALETLACKKKLALLETYFDFDHDKYKELNCGKIKKNFILYNIKKKKGFFWSMSLNKSMVFSVFDNLVNSSKKKWSSELNKEKNNLIFLDPGNKIFIQKLSKINFPLNNNIC